MVLLLLYHCVGDHMVVCLQIETLRVCVQANLTGPLSKHTGCVLKMFCVYF